MRSNIERAGRVMVAGLGIGLVALCALSPGDGLRPRPGHPNQTRPELARLVQAIGAARVSDGRVTGGFAYAPWLRTDSGTPPDLSPDARIAIANLEKKAERSSSDADWAALGTSYVLTGEATKAIDLLEAAVIAPDPNPQWLADLAAAYLDAARRGRQSDFVVRALSAAEHACRLAPSLREALFNRALALEAIRLHGRARWAWGEYLRADPDSGWSREAQAHIDALDRVTASRSENDIEALLGAIERGIAPDRQMVYAARQPLRIAIETRLLPAWADHVLAGNPAGARESLRVARTAATLLAEAGGDPMPRDAVASIDRVGGSRELSARLATAHLALRDALHEFDADEVEAAHRSFTKAVETFRVIRSPYEYWSAIYAAVPVLATRDFDRVLSVLGGRTVTDVDRRYRYVGGRRHWLMGLVFSNEGRFLEADAEYRFALESFEIVGELQSAAAIEALVAENLGLLGNSVDAWRHEIRALERLQDAGPDFRKHLILQIASVLSVDSGFPWAALHFQAERIKMASAAGVTQAVDANDSYLSRADILSRLDDIEGTRNDLERAADALRSVNDEPLKRRLQAEIAVATGEAYVSVDPPKALRALTDAIDYFNDVAGEARATSLYVARARAQLAAGSADRAQSDLIEALTYFDRERNRLFERRDRTRFFRRGWEAYAQMVRVQAVVRRNAMTALGYAERGRARTLLETVSNSRSIEPLDPASLQRQLPDRVAALFFVSLDDRLLVWVVRRQNIRMFDLPVTSAIIRSAVDRVRWRLMHASPDPPTRADLASLHQMLIEPLSAAITGTDMLVLIPDGPLHLLPFAALIDAKSSRYLVQDYVLASAASLSTMLRRGRFDQISGNSDLNALIVGNPAFNGGAEGAQLPSLAFAEGEAHDIGALYPQHLVLTGADATKQSFLAQAAGSDVVHYAGHALVDDVEPLLSRLMFANSTSLRRDEGFLLASELSSLRFRRPTVVILAACSTATGEVSRGEGLLGLTRPFLEAGASSVVATLWDVPDNAAAEFFLTFHKRFVERRSPAAALAQAQRDFITAADVSRRRPSRWAWAATTGTIPQESSIGGNEWRN
jgi:CHAT domain-containing protein